MSLKYFEFFSISFSPMFLFPFLFIYPLELSMLIKNAVQCIVFFWKIDAQFLNKIQRLHIVTKRPVKIKVMTAGILS